MSACISLTLTAFLGCKNSNKDAQSNDQLNTRAASSNFAASYGEDFNYYYSGYKKCDLDDEKLYFYEKRNATLSIDESYELDITHITLESNTNPGEKIVFIKNNQNHLR